MNIIPLVDDFQGSLWAMYEMMRRAVDGTVKPLFVDTNNLRVIVGGTSSTGNGAALQVQGNDLEITSSGKGLILADDGTSGKTARLTASYDSTTGNWTLTITTIS